MQRVARTKQRICQIERYVECPARAYTGAVDTVCEQVRRHSAKGSPGWGVLRGIAHGGADAPGTFMSQIGGLLPMAP